MTTDLTTPLPTPDVPAELIEAGATGHLVIFVGAGASRAAGFPSWEGLLDTLFRQAKAEASAEQLASLVEYEDAYEPRIAAGGRTPPPNLLVKASLIAQTMGDAFWRAKVVEIFDRPTSPTPVHQALAALPGTWIITTNYDRLMEKALAESVGRVPKVALATELEDLSLMTAGDVLKLHGDLDRPETLVLTREDYLEMSQGTANAWKERLKSWLQPPFQMLFVGYGYGYDDIDLQSIVQQLRYAYGKKLPGPFWLERNSPLARTKAKADGLRLIPLPGYDPIPFIDTLKTSIQNKKQSAPIYHRIRLMEDVVFEALPMQFEERSKRARKLYEDYHYDAAISTYQELLSDIQKCLIEPASTDDQLRIGRQWLARCRMSLGGCYLSIGQAEPAQELFHIVLSAYEQDSGLLRLTGRASLAEGLAALGELDVARSILPTSDEVAASELTEQVRTNIETVRIELEIASGNIPNELSQPWLRAQAVRVLVRRADFEKAEQMASTVLRDEDADWPTIYNASLALAQALISTIWENPIPQRSIPVNRRHSVIILIEEALQKLLKADMPQRLSTDALRLAARFYQITQHPLLQIIARQLAELGAVLPETEQQGFTSRILELARQDKFEEALSLLPPSDAAWAHRFEHAHMLFQVNRAEEARNLLQKLSADFPKRPIIEFHLAGLLLDAGEHAQALQHARAAFLQLPGWGQRHLLAQCLLSTGQPWKAYVLLGPLDGDSTQSLSSSPSQIEDAQRVGVLQLRAQAAGSLPALINRAVELYRRYLHVRPQDHRARIRRAQLLWGLSDGKNAAEEAWEAVSRASAAELAPRHLYDCAVMQSIGGFDVGKYRDRIQQVINWLTQRYKGNATAEQYRFYLLLKLGMPSDREPFDVKLLKEAGTLIPVEQDRALKLVKSGNEIYSYLHAQCAHGYITLETLCEQLDEQAAWVFTQILSSSPRGYLCAPHSVLEGVSIADLAGSHWLCGVIELLLLQHFGLLHSLKQALQPNGKLLLFSDVWERLVQDSGNLQERTNLGDDLAAPQSVMAAKRALDLHRFIGAGIQDGWIDIHLTRPELDEELPPLRDADQFPSQRQIWREDRCRAFSYRKALLNVPQLRVLTAEFGVVTLFPDSLGPLYLAWRDANHYLEFAREYRSVEVRMLHLPALVAALLPAAERAHEKLCQLADLGFQEALTPRELLRLAKRCQGLSKSFPSQLLARAEWQARNPDHLGFTTARMCLALTYANTIWTAFASVPRDQQDTTRPWTVLPDVRAIVQLGLHCSSAEAESVASALISRVEELAELKSDAMLDTFLQQLASTVVSDVGASGRLDGDAVVVSLDTPAGGLWRFLASWAGAQGPRRSALGRAIRAVWLLLDGENADEGPEEGGRTIFQEPTHPQAAVLQMGQTALELPPQIFIAPEQEAVAILCAHWSVNPLINAGSAITVQAKESKTYLYQELLSKAAEQMGAQVSANKQPLPIDEHFYLYQLPFDDQTTLPVPLPVEAVFLRTPKEVLQKVAGLLAQRQGIHDGRLYELLSQLAQAPEQVALRRLYARTAVSAPWRQVREEPSVLATWASRGQYRHISFPSTIADLRALLSEEPLPLSSDEPPALLEILKRRVEQGAWQHRSDKLQLYLQACEVPGWLVVGTISIRLNDRNLPREVAAALDRLTQPHNQTAARLAGDILFLRTAASRRPVVRVTSGVIDLRERLAERIASVLRAVIEPPPDGTLAHAEAPILRLCGQVVQELANPEQLPWAEGLWLTYRLYRWLVAQLATLPSDRWQQSLVHLHQLAPKVHPPPSSDVLNPFYFQSGRVDHRLMAVLYALSAGEQLTEAQKRERVPRQTEEPDSPSIPELPSFTVSSAELESILVGLASRSLTPDEQALRMRRGRPSALEWHHAAAVPDLALDVLLRLDDGNILKISSEARLSWIQQLPFVSEDKGSIADDTATLLLVAFSEHIEALTPIEHVALEDRLRTASRRDRVSKWRWLIYTALLEVGKEHLRDEVYSLFIQHLGDRAVPPMFGRYLMALGKQDTTEMRKVAIEILTAAVQNGHDAALLAWGLGRVILNGSTEAKDVATALIKDLAERDPYRGTPSMLQLTQWLDASGAKK
jgi:tetratricopeptide (TPR) repeat protein